MSESYADLVGRCAATRVEIDQDYHSKYGDNKKAFGALFGKAGFEPADLKKLADLRYYQGGYPSENSPPKAESLAETVSRCLILLAVLDVDQLKRHMNEMGVEVKISADLSYWSEKVDPAEWEAAKDYLGNYRPSTRREMLQTLVDDCVDLQGHICAMADSIKIDGAKVAKDSFQVEKPNFMKAVTLEALRLGKGDEKCQEKLDDAIAVADGLRAALDPVTQKLEES